MMSPEAKGFPPDEIAHLLHDLVGSTRRTFDNLAPDSERVEIRRESLTADFRREAIATRLFTELVIFGAPADHAVCEKHADCGFGGYCDFMGRCKRRLECRAGTDHCPPPLTKWNWVNDGSVYPLKEEHARSLEVLMQNTRALAEQETSVDYQATTQKLDEVENLLGVRQLSAAESHEEWRSLQSTGCYSSLEVTSPGPPYVPSGKAGLYGVGEFISLLKFRGIHVNPSMGMHVHFNVRSPKAPGQLLSAAAIWRVWAGVALFQYVINDYTLSPDRPGAIFNQNLNLLPNSRAGYLPRKVFELIHRYNGREQEANLGHFVEELKGIEERAKSPRGGVAHALGFRDGEGLHGPFYVNTRYFALNLSNIDAVNGIGTVEFRMHGATYDVERILRWITVCADMVDT